MTDHSKPPAYLDRIGRAFFLKLAPTLENKGLLTPATHDLIAMGCQAFSVYRNALSTLNKEGRVITSPTGAVKCNPQMQVERQAFEQVVKVFKALGMTINPSADAADDLTTFLETPKKWNATPENYGID